jgi:hypothetical protein
VRRLRHFLSIEVAGFKLKANRCYLISRKLFFFSDTLSSERSLDVEKIESVCHFPQTSVEELPSFVYLNA